MSRTSKTLLRLGVPSLAAATMLAGVPAFLGTANAAHIAALQLDSDKTAATGTCVPFTAKLTFSANQAPRVEDIDVVISEDAGLTAAESAAQDVDFCTAPTTTGTTTTTPSAPNAGASDSGAAGTSDRAEFVATVDPIDGTNPRTASVTFGVISNTPGDVTVRAFYEVDGSANENNSFDAGEFTDVKTATIVQGGANEADSVEVINTTEVATADVDTAVEGETRTYRVRVTDTIGNGGNPLPGVPVTFTIESNATPAGTADRGVSSFGVTDNDGIATGTITFPARATDPSSDVVTFFVNQTTGTTPNVDTAAGEPSDTVAVTVTDSAAQQNRTVTVQCLTGETSGAFTGGDQDDDATTAGTPGANINTQDPCVNSARDSDRIFRAVVNAADTEPSTAGTLLAFSVAGGSGDETVTPRESSTLATNANTGTDTAPATAVTTDDTTDPNDSAAEFELFDPTPVVGQTLTVTASVRGTSASDTETLTFRAEPRDARNIALTPDSGQTLSQGVATFTASVTDVNGRPVQGVVVDFTESGAGFIRGASSATTNASGQATVETTSAANETGEQTVTATIRDAGTTQATQAAGAGTTPQGGTAPASATAGNASDTGKTTFVTTVTPTATATPSATATATPTATATANPTPTGSVSPPAAVACVNPVGFTLNRDFIVPGIPATATITAPAGAVVEIQAYSRPSTDYRQVRSTTMPASGTVSFDLVPGTNTRLFAACVNQTASVSAQRVINVRTALSLTVVRNGTRNYTFQGRILPRRADQLITLYRITDSGARVLTSQLKTDNTGTYRINRRFTGSGTFGFLTRTGQTLTNNAGESNTPLTVEGINNGRGNARPTAIF